jgi:hypothetical protein
MRPLRLELLFPFQGYSLLLHPEQQLRNQKSPKALPHTTQSPRPKGAGQQKLNPTKPGYDRPGPAPPPPYRSSPNPVSQILMDTPPLHSKAAKGRHTNQAVMIWLRHYQSNPRGRAPARKLLCPVSTDTLLPHRKHPRQKRTIPAHQHATLARAFPITHTPPSGRRPPDKYSRDEYLLVAACLRLFRQTHTHPVGKSSPHTTPKAATI